MPQVGPMTMWVNSTTRRPSSGKGRGTGASGAVALVGDEWEMVEVEVMGQR
jgi:hypothetical protein